jgi:DnaK suppressor protein
MQDFKEQYNLLIKEKERLTRELDQINSEAPTSEEKREGSPYGKREEEATGVIELEKRLAMERQINDILAQINHALEKIDNGTYGTCDNCGQAIKSGRLEALPYANLCLACKANLAKKNRGTG